MNVLVIGVFPDEIKKRILSSFPAEWNIEITDLENSDKYLENVEIIIPEHVRIDAELISKAKNLQMIQTGTGYDNIDINECIVRGITVCNASGVNSNAVAEHTLAMILSWYKNIPYLDSRLKAHDDVNNLSYQGGEIRGKTIGIIGFGAIGKFVAKLSVAFGMNVLVCSRTVGKVDGITFVDLDMLLKSSDIVSLHVPATDETYHLINSQTLGKMKNCTLLVNTSRGSVVDENALIQALEKNQIAGACIDVFESEPVSISSRLRNFPNVILTPHTAGLPDGVKFHQKRYSFFAENISKFSKGKTPDNVIV